MGEKPQNIESLDDKTSQQQSTNIEKRGSSHNSDVEETDNQSIDNIKNDKSQENKESDTKEQLTKEQKEKLKQLRDKLKQYGDKKRKVEKHQKYKLKKSKLKNKEQPQEQKEEKEKPKGISEHANQFLKSLDNLPSFEEREPEDGYSIDTDGYTEIPDSVIRTLICKFLNQRFCKKHTDLNKRSNSLEKSKGFYKWEVKDVITHLKTHQITKVFDDKYGYQYTQGKDENIPLSFYFDMSGSMSAYTNQLAVIAIELLKKDVKVLIGFNSNVQKQINKLNKGITVEELVEILTKTNATDQLAECKIVNEELDDYLISSKAEKCVVFSDFDPRDSVCNLSHKAQVYWFCYEDNFSEYDVRGFNGFIYKVKDIYDIAQGLIKVNSNRFETLCFSNNEEKKGKEKRL